MTKNTEIHTIDEYIKEVRHFLPYSKEKMQEALDELRVDVESAITDTGETSPTKVFGTPRDVAMNIVESHPYWYSNRAGWWARLGAFVFDFIIEVILVIINIGACFLVIIKLIMPYDDLLEYFSGGNEAFNFFDLFTPEKILLILVITFFTIFTIIVVLGYHAVLEYYFGATLGKKLLHLLVVSQTGLRITWKQAIIRNLPKVIFSEEILPLDVILGMILEKMDPEKAHKQRGLDILAETIVIKL